MLAKVGCYVDVALADNAKFSLAVNRISHTVRKPPTLIDILSATVAQPVEHRPQILEVEASSSTWHNVFCAHFDTCGWNGVILSLFRFREQLRCRTALLISLNNALYDALPQLLSGCNKNLCRKGWSWYIIWKAKEVDVYK